MMTLPIWLFVLIVVGATMFTIFFVLVCLFLFGMWQTRKEYYQDLKQKEKDLKEKS